MLVSITMTFNNMVSNNDETLPYRDSGHKAIFVFCQRSTTFLESSPKGCCPSYSSTHLNWFICSSSFSNQERLFPVQTQVDLYFTISLHTACFYRKTDKKIPTFRQKYDILLLLCSLKRFSSSFCGICPEIPFRLWTSSLP